MNKVIGFTALAATALTISACAPTEVDYMYKPNTTNSSKARDILDCKVKGAKDVPANMSIGTTPTYTTPVNCSTYGSVYGYGGYSGTTSCTGGNVYGGNTYSYDANNSLRKSYILQCLADKGYTRTSIERCDQKTSIGPVKMSDLVKPPMANSCVVIIADGVAVPVSK